MRHYTLPTNDEGPCLEEPRINYISRKAKGVYANILLDDWYSKTFPNIFSSFFTAPPPQYTTCGGYSTGAAGSSPLGLSSRPTVASRVCI